MIIDAHSHMNGPMQLSSYHAGLIADRAAHGRHHINISDDELDRQMQRGMQQAIEAQIDFQLVSPRPYTVMQWLQPHKITRWFIEEANDLIARQVKLHPDKLVGVCSLPQGVGTLDGCVQELERCVKQHGFVGLLINPDPGEKGDDSTPGMGEEFWYPLYEKMCELDVPALIHPAACQLMRNPTFHLHFINEESTAIMSMVEHGVFETFPNLRIVVSHGGGAIPYQMGRFMAQWHGRDRRFDEAIRKLYYDTCLYTKDALELLFKSVGVDRCIYGTEIPGAGTHPHPDTGEMMDHLVPVIESIEWLTAEDKKKIFEDNARAVYNLKLPAPASAV